MKKKLIILLLLLFVKLYAQQETTFSFGSGMSSASDVSYKISLDDSTVLNTRIKKISNRFRDIDFKSNIDPLYSSYSSYVDILLGLASSTIMGLEVDVIDVSSANRMTFKANKIMYSFEDWNAFVDERTTSLSNIQAKAKIDIQSVSFDVYPPEIFAGIDQILSIILLKSSAANNILIKKMTIDTELLNNKIKANSRLDLAIGRADADIEILVPRIDGDDPFYILNFEIKLVNIDSDIASLLDASIITLGLPIQKKSYGYLFKLTGTLSNPQPVLE